MRLGGRGEAGVGGDDSRRSVVGARERERVGEELKRGYLAISEFDI